MKFVAVSLRVYSSVQADLDSLDSHALVYGLPSLQVTISKHIQDLPLIVALASQDAACTAKASERHYT